MSILISVLCVTDCRRAHCQAASLQVFAALFMSELDSRENTFNMTGLFNLRRHHDGAYTESKMNEYKKHRDKSYMIAVTRIYY